MFDRECVDRNARGTAGIVVAVVVVVVVVVVVCQAVSSGTRLIFYNQGFFCTGRVVPRV